MPPPDPNDRRPEVPPEEQELSVDVTVSAQDMTWAEAEAALFAKDTQKFLRGLAYQEVDYIWVEEILRKVTSIVDARLGSAVEGNNNFAEPDKNRPTFPNRVTVVPRGSFASRTALRNHVDLDLDLVFPPNFIINTNLGKRTIEQVLCVGHEPDLTKATPAGHDASGKLVITKVGLWLVLRYVWLKLVHYGAGEYVEVNLPEERKPGDPDKLPYPKQPDILNRPSVDWLMIHPGPKGDKTLDKITRSIPAKTKAPENEVDIDFFVKVITTYQGGQTVVVGVDKDGPLGVRQYQTTTFISSGLQWLGDDPLPPIERTALMALKWWKNSFKDDATIQPFKVRNLMKTDPKTGRPVTDGSVIDGDKAKIKVKSHHLLSALNALRELDPSDPLYVPRTSSLPFSLVRVIDRMIKTLTYLHRAYNPPQNFLISRYNSWSTTIPKGEARVEYIFPEYSCGTFDTLWKQLHGTFEDGEYVYKSKVIPTFLRRLKAAQAALIKPSPSFDPNEYVEEETYDRN